MRRPVATELASGRAAAALALYRQPATVSWSDTVAYATENTAPAVLVPLNAAINEYQMIQNYKARRGTSLSHDAFPAMQ